jgi:signal transduction histidine kinase
MPISRLRLRLAAWFGFIFLLALVVLDVGFLGYARRQAQRRLTREVTVAAAELRDAISKEHASFPQFPPDSAVEEVLGEWPAGPDVIVVFDASGRRLGARGASGLVERLAPGALGAAASGTLDLPEDREGRLRIGWARDDTPPAVTVVTGSSTAGLEEEEETLTGWLLASLPLIGIGAAAAGYALARRALRPVQQMARDLDAIDVQRIDRRLPVGSHPDELDQLASHFNGLLDRLAGARETNRRFLAQAAHQLRTPLTIVRGESDLGLDRPRSADDYQSALRRISLAAELMSRRVGELLLIAEAESGERPALTERLELDGVALEAADLMRGRASALSRTLEFGTVEEVVVQGAAMLVREAVLELLENACRHGTAQLPVQLSVFRTGTRGLIQVTNAGPPIGAAAPSGGLGLSIVRWVAEMHGGEMEVARRGPLNAVTLNFPLATAPADTRSPGPSPG